MIFRKMLIVMIVLFAVVATGCATSEAAETTNSASAEVVEAQAAEDQAAEVVAEPAVEPAAEVVAEPAVEPASAEAAETSAEAGNGGAIAFAIVPAGTEARFSINEVLMGQDKTVIGTTSDVTGEIMIDPANPSATQIGPITVNARDLTTDDNRRTGQLRNNILKSGQDTYQYIVFTPTALEGLPETVTVGQPFEFQITGDLTILDVTKSVTFDMTVTPNSETELIGSGTTTILYPDFGISIPSVPFVANVTEEVGLAINFTAVAAAAE